MSRGCSGTSSSTRGTSARQARPTVSATGFHAPPSASHAISGRKTSAPVAVLAVSIPIISPCRLANQRLTIAAPSTLATAPLPIPDSRPQVSRYCHGACIHRLPIVAAAISTSPPSIVRRMPSVIISAAANGPTSP